MSWFHRQTFKWPKISQQSHLGAVIPFIGLEIMLVNSAVLQLFGIYPSWFECVFSSRWLPAQESKRQHTLWLVQVNPRFMFVSWQTAHCSFTKLSIAHYAQCSWPRELVYSQNTQLFLRLGRIKFRSCSYHKKLYQSSFVTRLRPPFQIVLGLVVLIHSQVWLLCSQWHKHNTLGQGTHLGYIK